MPLLGQKLVGRGNNGLRDGMMLQMSGYRVLGLRFRGLRDGDMALLRESSPLIQRPMRRGTKASSNTVNNQVEDIVGGADRIAKGASEGEQTRQAATEQSSGSRVRPLSPFAAFRGLLPQLLSTAAEVNMGSTVRNWRK